MPSRKPLQIPGLPPRSRKTEWLIIIDAYDLEGIYAEMWAQNLKSIRGERPSDPPYVVVMGDEDQPERLKKAKSLIGADRTCTYSQGAGPYYGIAQAFKDFLVDHEQSIIITRNERIAEAGKVHNMTTLHGQWVFGQIDIMKLLNPPEKYEQQSLFDRSNSPNYPNW